MKLTASGLLIPTRMNEAPKYQCNVPGCDAVFYEGEERARVRHSLEHAYNDHEQIEEAIRDPHDEILGEGDPERQNWLKRRFEQLKGEVPDPLNPKRY